MKTKSTSLYLLLSSCSLFVSVTSLTRRSFGEECSRINKCDRTAWLSCRDGKCACTESDAMSYDEGKKKCVTISGERCKYGVDESEENVLVENTECVSNAVCNSEGICLCDSEYHALNNGSCGLSITLGGNCTEGDQCSKYFGLICADSKCQCQEGVYLEENGKCVGLSQNNCGPQSECVEGAVCVHGKCLCDSDHYHSVQKTCLKKKSIFQSCSRDAECSQTNNLNLRCISGNCRCPEKLVYSKVQKFEYSVFNRYKAGVGYKPFEIGFTGPLVEMCAPALGEKCPHGYCMENAFCDAKEQMSVKFPISMDSCKCIDKTISPNKDYQYCGKIYGQNCKNKFDCIDDLVCSDGKCDCPLQRHQSFDSSTRKCVTKVGAHCTRASTCVENAECAFLSPTSRSGHCRCERNFIVNGDRFCDRSYGTNCSESISPKCDTLAGLVCVNNKCSCKDAMYKYDLTFRKCLGLVGASCNKSEERITCVTGRPVDVENLNICNVTSQSKLTCVENAFCNEEHRLLEAECKCMDGYEETDDHTCVDISNPSINSAVCDPSKCRCGDPNRCIPAKSRCDGKTDCLDQSSEEGCTAEVISESNFDNSTCDMHRCNNGQCIRNEWVCDGVVHCDDSSDEKDCRKNDTNQGIIDPGNFIVCSANKWTCRSGQCIDRLSFCDGLWECSDYSDEPEGCKHWERCNSQWNRHSSFSCFSEGCINRDLLCNGSKDCVDGSDETICAFS